MRVKACIYTDLGRTRKINQDAALVKVARSSRNGRMSLVAVCDGMGGLQKGEVASCKAVRTLESWFHEELPLLQNMQEKELWDVIESSLERAVIRINGELRRYGKHRGIQLGTTLTALFQMGNRYLTVNVGDSRIYAIKSSGVSLLTRDQSVVQDKMDKGLITKDEASFDQQKNVLLQCVGANQNVTPQILSGTIDGPTTIIACSDGFWRTMEPEQVRQKLCPQMCLTDEDMLNECKKLADAAIEKNEEDNISVAAVCFE